MKGHPNNLQYPSFQWWTQKANWCSPFSQRQFAGNTGIWPEDQD